MTAHKNRAGQLLTSGSCKQGRHGGECAEFLTEIADLSGAEPIVCHCSCHPDDGCVPTIRKSSTRKRVCPECNLQHAGEC